MINMPLQWSDDQLHVFYENEVKTNVDLSISTKWL